MKTARSRIALLLLLSLAALMVPIVAHADTCSGTVVEIPVKGAALFYLDARDSTGTWIYMEDNATPGLQRGGGTGLEGDSLGGTDPCVDMNGEEPYNADSADLVLF